MPPVVAAILEGMPDPRDLRRFSTDGETLIFAGSRLLFRYRDGDAGARNVAVAVLRQLGYSGQAVAARGTQQHPGEAHRTEFAEIGKRYGS